MIENNRFYATGMSPTEIIRCTDTQYYIYKWDWAAAPMASDAKYKVFSIEFDSNIGHIEEVPDEFLNLENDIDKYETSINYTIHGQFFTSELAFRAHKRLFNWDMYVYRLPHSQWLPVRESPVTRKILENYFPHKTGDTGPAGGIIIKCDATPSEHGYHCVEAAPFNAGWATWHEALKICEEISINGIGGWRLPSVDELRSFAATLRRRLRERENVQQTTETVLNWSGLRKGENAVAVVTQENEDFWQYLFYYTLGGTSGGFYRSKNGPYMGHEKELPVTHSYPVRLVRDLYVKEISNER